MPSSNRNTKKLLRILDPSRKLPFTDAAQARIEGKTSHYQAELLQQSIQLATRENLDIVSPAHVDHAAEQLKARKKDRGAMGIAGGVFGGASLSTLLSLMFFEDKINIIPGTILVSLFAASCLSIMLDVLRK